MLIIRRSNCIDTTSGIVFSVSDRPVCTPDSHLQRILYQKLYKYKENTVLDVVLILFDLLMMSTELLETFRGL